MSALRRHAPTATSIAATIGEPARSRILYSLLDGRARTSTELAVVAGVTPSTASAHLHRLRSQQLVHLFAQGKHRYYSLAGTHVAALLESLSVLAGPQRPAPVPKTPARLLAARTCYDHIAGTLGVRLHDQLLSRKWLAPQPGNAAEAYHLFPAGDVALRRLGIDLDAARSARRRFAYPCLDWSERRPHLAGALAAGLLHALRSRRWISADPNSRALAVTTLGRAELHALFGLRIDPAP